MPLARYCDFDRTGYVDVAAVHAALVRKFGQAPKQGRQNEAGAEVPYSPLERIQARIQSRHGPVGVHLLARKFRSLDPTGQQVLSREELRFGFEALGVPMSMRDVEDLLVYFDEDRSGGMTVDELLRGLRGKMSRKRRAMVKRVFEHLDQSGDGSLSLEEMRLAVDVSRHPDVLSGALTEAEATRQFMAQWDSPNGDGIISLHEFVDYYHSVSAMIDGEEFFAQMLRDSWGVDDLPLHDEARGKSLGASRRGMGTARGVGEHHGATERYRDDSSTAHWERAARPKPMGSTASRRSTSGRGAPDSPRSVTSAEMDDRRLSRREERGEAVKQVQRLYRGHKSREVSTYEQRKEKREAKEREAERATQSRKAKRYIRPALRTTYGF